MNVNITNDEITDIIRIIRDITGWVCKFHPNEKRAQYWTCSYRNKNRVERQVTVYIGLSEQVLTFQLPMVIYVLDVCKPAVYYYLLQLNANVKIVKFGIDERNGVYLFAEMLADSVNQDTVRAYLECLVSYFDMFYREIEMLGANPELAEMWLQIAQRGNSAPFDIEVAS